MNIISKRSKSRQKADFDFSFGMRKSMWDCACFNNYYNFCFPQTGIKEKQQKNLLKKHFPLLFSMPTTFKAKNFFVALGPILGLRVRNYFLKTKQSEEITEKFYFLYIFNYNCK